MESALMIAPPSFSASASASADLPLAVGPAMRTIFGSLTGLTYSVFARIKIPQSSEIAKKPSDPDKTLPRVAAGAGTRRRGVGPALCRAVEHGGARARHGQ